MNYADVELACSCRFGAGACLVTGPPGLSVPLRRGARVAVCGGGKGGVGVGGKGVVGWGLRCDLLSVEDTMKCAH